MNETPPFRGISSATQFRMRWRLTGRLGWQDSNLCIRNLCPAGSTAVVPCEEGRSCTRLLESGARPAATPCVAR